MNEIRVRRDLAMETRDGTRLMADVYFPPGPGPFPTLLYRVRGSKSSGFIIGAILLNPVVAAERGYAVCIQEVRGRGSSEGEWEPFVHEEDDGVDTLEWLVAQPWCNGRVGSYGTAYTGFASLAMAATGHPALQAVVVAVSGVSPQDGWVYTNGGFELGWNTFWTYLTATESLRRLPAEPGEKERIRTVLQADMESPVEVVNRLPITSRDALAQLSPHYWEWLDHASYDPYWEKVDLAARADQFTARVLSITGWWDNFLGAHLQLYRELANRSPTGADQSLVIGPWDHFTYVNVVPTMAGARDFGPEGMAGPAITEPLALDWFDRWLKDTPEGATTRPGVRYYAVGGGGWQETPLWPPASMVTPWYLQGGGGLATVPPAPAPPSTYEYDPADPTPTRGGRTLMPTLGPSGVQDQSELLGRPDLLEFTSAALSDPVSVAGRVRLRLWAASSAVDTDFAAVLVDCAPSGERWLVADGFLRARHRNGFGRTDWLTPGEVVEYTIDLWDVAWTFAAGHRIGLHISSASFPRFNRNLNVALPPGEGTLTEAVTASQAIYHDPDHPSALLLPQV